VSSSFLASSRITATESDPDDSWHVRPAPGVESPDHCNRGVELFDTERLEFVKVRCKRRQCSSCGPRHWVPKVTAQMRSGLGGPASNFVVLLLTAPGDAELGTAAAMAEWNGSASRRWHRFMTILSRELRQGRIAGARQRGRLEFWRVSELQRRGAIHLHVVLRGVNFLPVEAVRRIAVAVGFGPFVGVKSPDASKGGTKGLRSYFSKYLLKAAATWAEPGQRIYSKSRGWALFAPEWQSSVTSGRFMFIPWGSWCKAIAAVDRTASYLAELERERRAAAAELAAERERVSPRQLGLGLGTFGVLRGGAPAV